MVGDGVGVVLVFVGMPALFILAAHTGVTEWKRIAYKREYVQGRDRYGCTYWIRREKIPELVSPSFWLHYLNPPFGKGVMRPGKAPYLPTRH